jgi:predicted histone-like DNA-binding protein
MINFSVNLRLNPLKPEEAKKAYANAQYTEVMDLDAFAEHIASHGTTYSRADIHAVLILAVDCMREQLLAGRRIQMGDLGTFAVGLKSNPTNTIAEFSSKNISKVKVVWRAGTTFQDLLPDATFNQVPSRAASALVTKAVKAGETTVDLSTLSSASGSTGNSGTSSNGTSGSGSSSDKVEELEPIM